MTATDLPAAETRPAPPAARGRRVTFAVLWVAFALWVAALLAMYVATVYPQRHPEPGHPATAVPASPPPRRTMAN